MITVIMMVVGLICIGIINYLINKKNVIIFNDLERTTYDEVMFHNSIEGVNIENILNIAYTMYKNEEDNLNKYLTFIWGLIASFILLFVEILKVDTAMPELKIFILIFISVCGFLFSINYYKLLENISYKICSIKCHITFLEHRLGFNFQSTFFGNQYTKRNPLALKIILNIVGVITLLWELAFAVSLLYVLKGCLLADVTYINDYTFVIIFFTIIDIVKIITLKNNKDILNTKKSKINDNIFVID